MLTSFAGNKCDPEPCENGGRCIRDNKRMDGYRCKCTSDFTGRNCQGNNYGPETRRRDINGSLDSITRVSGNSLKK